MTSEAFRGSCRMRRGSRRAHVRGVGDLSLAVFRDFFFLVLFLQIWESTRR